MSKTLSKVAPFQCSADKTCSSKFEQRHQLVYHLALDHVKVEEVYERVVEAILPFGLMGDVVLEKCLFEDCREISKTKFTDFLCHLTFGHFENDILKEIRGFQVNLFEA